MKSLSPLRAERFAIRLALFAIATISLCASSLTHAQTVRQDKLYIDDGSGSFTVLKTNGMPGGSTVQFPNVAGTAYAMLFGGSVYNATHMWRAGDIVFASAAGNSLDRLPRGNDGQVLTLVSGLPSWQDPSAGTGSVTQVSTGNGLTGGPITSTGTINLSLNASGGLSKTLGAGSNELGIAAGGVTSAMITSIDASKITTSGSGLTTSTGGTGQTSYAYGDLLVGTAGGSLTKLGLGGPNSALVVNGSGVLEWGTNVTTVMPSGGSNEIAYYDGTSYLFTPNLTYDGHTLAASNGTSNASPLTASNTASTSSGTADGATISATGTGSGTETNVALQLTSGNGGSGGNYDVRGTGGTWSVNNLGGASFSSLTLGTPLAIGQGGTGQTTKTAAFDALSPMSASGDIIYGGASGTGTRLAKGNNNQVLTLVGGLPSWQDPSVSASSATFTNNSTTGAAVSGDNTTSAGTGSTALGGEFSSTGTGTGSGTNVALQLTSGNGGTGGNLDIRGTGGSWYVTNAGAATFSSVTSSGAGTFGSISTTGAATVGSISSTGAASFGSLTLTTPLAIAQGGTGQTTKSAAFDALSPMSASGDIIYGGASGTGTRLAKGTNNQVLTLVGGLPSWQDPAAGSSSSTNAASASAAVSGTNTFSAGNGVTAIGGSFASTGTGSGTGANVALQLTSSGAGSGGNIDVRGTSGNWSVTSAGAANFASLTLGTPLAINQGGTGQITKTAAFDALSPMSASGDLIYGGTSGTGTRLAKGSDGAILTLVSGLPSWTSTLAAETFSNSTSASAAATGNNTFSAGTGVTAVGGSFSATGIGSGTETNVALQLNSANGGSGGNYDIRGTGGNWSVTGAGAANFASLTLGTPLAIGQGGTGQTTKQAAFDALSPNGTTGDITYYNASGHNTNLGIGTTGQVLTVSGGLPVWSSSATSSFTAVNSPNVYGGSAVGSTLNLQSTSNASPSGDFLTITTGNTERIRVDNAGHVGIGTSGPNTKLDVNGDFATRATTNSTTGSALNNVSTSSTSNVFFTGPTTDFTVTGFANGSDGKRLRLYNKTGHNMTIQNQNTGSTAGNRINTLSGGDVTLVGNGAAEVVYDGTASEWVLAASLANQVTGVVGTPQSLLHGTTRTYTSATLTNDTALSWATGAGQTWEVDGVLTVIGSANSDALGLAIKIPGTPSLISIGIQGVAVGNTSSNGIGVDLIVANGTVLGTPLKCGGTQSLVYVHGVFTTGATSGTTYMQCSLAGGTTVTVQAASFLRVTRIQ